MRVKLTQCASRRLLSAVTATLTMTLACAGFASSARAEYIVLRSGQRLHVSGYQLLEGKYRLQIEGGIAEMQAEEVVAIEPEEIFVSNPPAARSQGPFSRFD